MLKRRRLPNGNWITQKLAESSSEDLAKAKPEEIWECGDGRRILPKDMEIRHLINTMNFLRSKLWKQTNVERSTLDNLTRQAEPIFKHLEAELQRRASGAPKETLSRKITLED
jgi:hypothetical protein